MDIKPIETYYNGYRFRSRLEARWAVFFDALGIRYQYEIEGYKLSDGQYYLPDFFLPDDGYYVEVKGYSEHIIKDLDKVNQFVYEAKKAVIILSEIPFDPKSKGLFLFPIMYFSARSGGMTEWHYALFSEADGCGYIQDDFAIGLDKNFNYHPRCPREEKEPNAFAYKAIQALNGSDKGVDSSDDANDWTAVKNFFDLSSISEALLKARQARFEYGETPKTSKVTLFDYDKIPF